MHQFQNFSFATFPKCGCLQHNKRKKATAMSNNPHFPLPCLVVEDEPLAAEILAEYIGMSPHLELVHTITFSMSTNDR